jgi:alpha-amylase
LTYNPESKQWSGVIDLPAKQDIQWKCIVRSNDAPGTARWQPGANVSLTSEAGRETRGAF